MWDRLARWLISLFFGRFGFTFPVGTLFINITGSLLLGWFYVYGPRHQISGTTVVALSVGFIGAYTTFSTYMYESYKLAVGGAYLAAATNLLGSLALGIAAVWLGSMLAK